MHETELVVCMGSACFSRGNLSTIETIQRYLKDHGLEDEVQVTGTLCQNRCRQGPNLTINGESFSATATESLTDLLEEHLGHLVKVSL